jgi:hypothetical protein
MSKIALVMRGLLPLFKPPKQKGADPPSGNPLMCLFDRGRHQFINISQTKIIVWGLNRAFLSQSEASRAKPLKHVYNKVI